MSCGNQDEVDDIACSAGEVTAFEQAIGCGLADDRLNRWLIGLGALCLPRFAAL
jgi:hypothetical protein